jgi:protein ImuB
MARQLIALVLDWPVLAVGAPYARPVAIIEHGHVYATSPAARVHGVWRGQPRREAEALAPGLMCCARDLGAEARRFEPIARALGELTPALELTRPGLCALPARAPARYFGGEEALASLVRHEVTPLLPSAGQLQVGIADTRLAAMLAARSNGRVVPGADAAFLAPFPVGVLPSPSLVKVLAALGITTLGALVATGEGTIGARFGTEGIEAWRAAAGIEQEPLVLGAPPSELVCMTPLDPPAERIDAIAFATRTMTEEFTRRLADRGLSCASVEIVLESEHAERLARTWRTPRLLRSDRLAEAIRWQLEGWLATGAGVEPPTAGITLVRISAQSLFPATGDQLTFDGAPSPRRLRAERALERLGALLGPGALLRASIGGGRDPAARVAFANWGEDAPPTSTPGPWPGGAGTPSPAVVYAQPRTCALVDHRGGSVAVSGRGVMREPPVALQIEGSKAQDVVSFAGPWLYEEAWWTRRARRRARLQLVLEDGSAHLCYLEQGQWWLEATYD